MPTARPHKKTSFLKKAAWLLAVTSAVSAVVCACIGYRLFFSDLFSKSRVITVPNLTGKIYHEALLGDRDAFQTVRVECFSDAPIGTVLSQTPAPGSERKTVPGKRYVTLTLQISKGIEAVAVPSVLGMSSTEGEATLLSLGFSVRCIDRYDPAPVGEIIAQDRASGETLKKGDTVTLTVSRGEAIRKATVPHLSGLTPTQANSLIEASGFRIGKTVYRASDGDEGLVLGQSPLAGVTLPTGARIDLTVSKKQPETTEAETETPSPDTTEVPSEVPPSQAESDTSESTERGEGDNRETQEESPEDAIDRILEGLFERFRHDSN